MSLRGVAGGLLRSVGAFMQQDWLAQREAALEQLRQMRADQRSERQFEQQRTIQAEGIQQRGAEERRTLEASTDEQLVIQDDRQQHEMSVEEQRQSHDRAMENLRHDNRLSEQQAQIAEASAARLREAGQTIGGYIVDNSGRVIFYNERGRTISMSQPGTTAPDRSARGGGGGRQPRTARGAGAAQPTRSGVAAGGSDEAILQQFGPVVDSLHGRLPPAQRLQKARELAQRYGG